MEPPKQLSEILKAFIENRNCRADTEVKAKNMHNDIKSRDKVRLLKKSLDGLRQTGRSWLEKLYMVLKSVGNETNSGQCV